MLYRSHQPRLRGFWHGGLLRLVDRSVRASIRPNASTEVSAELEPRRRG